MVTIEQPTIELEMRVGSRVTLLEDVDIDRDGGSASKIVYEAYVDRHNPSTGVLEMSDGTKRSEFMEMLETSDGIEILLPDQ